MSPTPSSPDPQANRPTLVNRTFLQYRIVEKLGAGGMGEIYKARDTRLNRFVAVKVLTAGTAGDPERRRRFIHEAQAASALNHPNIVTIYDIVPDGDAQYMVMEFIDGKTLGQLIPDEGMRIPQAVKFAAQIADALSAAHSAGIIHRDLKPANIMVSGSGFVKLLDFGLAKMVEPELATPDAETRTMIPGPAMTVEGALMGTVNYMSPEQAEGRRLDARSDIFSFGSVLYEMLTGRRAFRGSSTIATLSAVLRDDVPPMAELAGDVPVEIQQIVARCLKKNPAERFQSMQEIQAALAPLKNQPESHGVSGRPAGNVNPPRVKAGTSNASAKGIVFLIVLVALGGGGYWWKTRQASVAAPVRPPSTASSTPVSPIAPDVSDAVRVPAVEHPPDKATGAVTLGDGHPVQLILMADIPSNAGVDDAVSFQVAEDVLVGDSVVIRKGTAAGGVIVDGVKRKLVLFTGKMTFRLETVVMADGQRADLRATAARSGGGSSKRLVDNGTNKRTKDVAAVAGTVYVGYIDGTRYFGESRH